MWLEYTERETTARALAHPEFSRQPAAEWLALAHEVRALAEDRERLSADVRQLTDALAAERQRTQELSVALQEARDHGAVQSERAELLTQLCDILPRALVRLRGNRAPALLLELGRNLSHPEVAVRLAHLLMSLGRADDAQLVLESVSGGEWQRAGASLERLARDAVSGQQTPVVDLLRGRLAELPQSLRVALEAHTEFDRGALSSSIRHVEGNEDASARLVHIRNLLANNRFEEARAILACQPAPAEVQEELRRRGNEAVAALSEGEYRKAAAQLEEVTTAFEIHGMEVQTAVGYNNLAAAWEILGRYTDAFHALRRGTEALTDKSMQHARIRIRTLISQGYLDITLGLFDRGRRTLEEAEQRARDAKNGSLEAEAILQQSRCALHAGELSMAQGALARAQVLAAEFGTADTRARFRTFETEISLLTGRPASPLDASDPEIRHETRRELMLAEAWRRLVVGEPERALELADTLIQEADAVFHAEIRWTARLLRAASLEARGGSGDGDRRAALELRQALANALPAAWKTPYLAHPRHQVFLALAAAVSRDAPPQTAAPAAPRRSAGRVVGQDPELLRTLSLAERYAESDAAVLSLGESGTGKELLAELIHDWSPRRNRPLVRVNAAALSDTLLLSELFGHEKGAFTGADRQKAGKFEMAHGGTLFLDEIGDISTSTQTALLRVLQDGAFHRLGGSELVRTDARVIVATNRDLSAMVEAGTFRLDLYYRVSSLALTLPPLRTRMGDLPALVEAFMAELPSGSKAAVSPQAMEQLARHRWPGNVRELRNVLERLVRVAVDGKITADLVREFGPQPSASPASRQAGPRSSLADARPSQNLDELRRGLEREQIRKALEAHGGNISHAADALGVNRSTLSRKVKSYGLLGH
jgi:DNA-binding NtrC family response regulator